MSETADRPWWADVQHLKPSEGDGSARPSAEHAPRRDPARSLEHRSHRFDRAAEQATRPVAVAVADEPRRPALDFDFDLGLSSLLDPPKEETGEWIELTVDEALGQLAAPSTATDGGSWLEEAVDARASLTADDKASGWDLDVWTETDDARKQRRTVEIRGRADSTATTVPAAPATSTATVTRRRPRATSAERLSSRPDRVAMWAFILGLLLIAIAAIGTPKANAAEIDAAAAHQAPAIVVAADATP